jgi:hypothetical protein
MENNSVVHCENAEADRARTERLPGIHVHAKSLAESIRHVQLPHDTAVDIRAMSPLP